MAFAEYQINGMMGPAQLACQLAGEDPHNLVSVDGVPAPRWVRYAVDMLRLKAMVEAARAHGITII